MKTTGITYDASAHRYFLGARELLAVTRILKDAGLIDPRWYSEESALRGTYVHAATDLFDEGTLDEAQLDPLLQPYVAAYRQFTADVRPSWAHREVIVHDAVLGYAGRVDRVGLWDGLPPYLAGVVVDVKTGTVPPSVGPQTAAYARCLPGIYARYALNLRDDGSYRLVPLTDRADGDTFLAALRVVQFRREKGLIDVD